MTEKKSKNPFDDFEFSNDDQLTLNVYAQLLSDYYHELIKLNIPKDLAYALVIDMQEHLITLVIEFNKNNAKRE